jgi:hypothetical protein
MRTTRAVPAILAVLLPAVALATPSTTYWAPSTASCQGWAVPHITFDTYFDKGPAAGSAGAPNYPTDVGLEVGFLPSEKVQAEAGFDILLPSEHPYVFNAKVCTPESSLFRGSPAASIGIYNVGFEDDVTDYNVAHLMFQKSFPKGGYVALGGYYGGNETLMTNSEGDVVRSGFMFALASPDIVIGRKGLKKMNFVGDVQTGKNVLGAWGVGTNVYFASNVSLLVGPVFFLDPDIQPGGADYMWTVQLDIDVPLGRDE